MDHTGGCTSDEIEGERERELMLNDLGFVVSGVMFGEEDFGRYSGEGYGANVPEANVCAAISCG